MQTCLSLSLPFSQHGSSVINDGSEKFMRKSSLFLPENRSRDNIWALRFPHLVRSVSSLCRSANRQLVSPGCSKRLRLACSCRSAGLTTFSFRNWFWVECSTTWPGGGNRKGKMKKNCIYYSKKSSSVKWKRVIYRFDFSFKNILHITLKS